jgi:hypothetical protein
MRGILLSLIALACSFSAGAQTPASILRLGYQGARLTQVAPGQVVHLTLEGLTTVFTSTQVAQTVPLPTNFQGLTVSLQRSGPGQIELLPLLRLDLGSTSCDSTILQTANAMACAPGAKTYDLWVQIPYDLQPNTPGADNTACPELGCNFTDAILILSEESGTGRSLRVLPVVDQVHLLNSCTDNIGTVGLEGASAYASYACVPAITHANGSWVTTAAPARPGEELVAYAFGLGAPATRFDTVSATPAGGVPLGRPVGISFTGVVSQPAAAPDYVGLVGGSAGLYQINFHVPAVPANLAPCTGPASLTQLAINPFNLTMTLLGTASVDQASFCVRP